MVLTVRLNSFLGGGNFISLLATSISSEVMLQCTSYWYTQDYYLWYGKFCRVHTSRLHPQLFYGIIIHSFISGMHHYVCIAPNIDIILQSGRFWATSIASLGERFHDSRSYWVAFIHAVRGRPGGLLQFSKGEAVKICLAPEWSRKNKNQRFNKLTHIQLENGN